MSPLTWLVVVVLSVIVGIGFYDFFQSEMSDSKEKNASKVASDKVSKQNGAPFFLTGEPYCMADEVSFALWEQESGSFPSFQDLENEALWALEELKDENGALLLEIYDKVDNHLKDHAFDPEEIRLKADDELSGWLSFQVLKSEGENEALLLEIYNKVTNHLKDHAFEPEEIRQKADGKLLDWLEDIVLSDEQLFQKAYNGLLRRLTA